MNHMEYEQAFPKYESNSSSLEIKRDLTLQELEISNHPKSQKLARLVVLASHVRGSQLSITRENKQQSMVNRSAMEIKQESKASTRECKEEKKVD